MRFITTICFVLLTTVCPSQVYEMIRMAAYSQNTYIANSIQLCGMKGTLVNTIDIQAVQVKAYRVDSVPPRITIRCGRSLNSRNKPLLVIDGLPVLENFSFSTFDTSQIESIEVLKSTIATAIYGSEGMHGVILVTTKKSGLRKFVIKDFVDGNPISGATVSFISSDKKDTMMMAANDSGMAYAEKLKPSKEYQLQISAVGYAPYTSVFKIEFNKNEYPILLKRGEWQCAEAVIACHGPRRISCGFGAYYIREESFPEIKTFQLAPLKSYPNPVQKGKIVTIETTGLSDQAIELKLFSLDGKLLLTQPQRLIKGLNRLSIAIDSRWASGVYFLLIYVNGKSLASDKIMIQ